jgi:hypothetical protein
LILENELGGHTDKKENKIFLIYKEILIEAVAKSYMWKGFQIYEEMRKYLVTYEVLVPLLSSCWVQDRARFNALSSVLKRLLAYRVEEDGGPGTEVLLGPGKGEVQRCVLSLEEAVSAQQYTLT